MANIQEILNKILGSRYGRDVRQAIHDGIQQCYYDGKAGEIDLQARQDIDKTKKLIHGQCYGSLTLALNAIGITLEQSTITTAELFDLVGNGTTITFFSTSSEITDLPGSGVVELIRGVASTNLRYAWFHSNDGTLWHYKYHASNTAGNGWNEYVKKSEVQNLMISSSVDIAPDKIINTATFRRRGNIVQISFGKIIEEVEIGTTVQIATIPEGFLPTVGTNGVIPVTVGVQHYSMYVAVARSGVLQVRFMQDIPVGTQLYAVFTYMI